MAKRSNGKRVWNPEITVTESKEGMHKGTILKSDSDEKVIVFTDEPVLMELTGEIKVYGYVMLQKNTTL